MPQPLEGVKVLELVRVAPGAFTTMMLADMGAEVVKIETPPQMGSTGGSGASSGEKEMRRAAFDSNNRNKKSIAINLKHPQGQQLFRKLAETSDVLVEGFRPGVMKRLGGDYETLSRLNPRLIYCSLSGYGQNGPYRDLPGHDINYISHGGCLYVIGEEDRLPAVPLNLMADFASAALHGVIGILLALRAREKTGRGQYVDISYMDGVVALMAGMFWPYFFNGAVPQRGQTALSGVYPYYAVFETKDGKQFTLGCMEPHFWVNLCRALGKEEWADCQHSSGNFFRRPGERSRQVLAQLREIFRTRTRDEWFELLRQHDICIGKVYSWDEVFADPQVLHRRMLEEIDHPQMGKVRQVGIAIKLSETPGSIRSLGPYLGQHTDHILKGLGYTPEGIAELRQQGAVV